MDFGFADTYINQKTGEHIKEKEDVDTFQGNMMFASIDQMDFYKTSRRDDIISLFYLIVNLLNNGKFVSGGKKQSLLVKVLKNQLKKGAGGLN